MNPQADSQTFRLFTANYPFGFGESFINNELPFLENEFEKMVIYPYAQKGTLQKTFNSKAEVKVPEQVTSERITLKDRIEIAGILISEFIHVKQKMTVLKRLRYLNVLLRNAFQLARWLEKESVSGADLFYSFWMNEWSLALAVLKKQGKIDKFVFRINGYDIHDERHPGNYLPFRYFTYRYAERIFPLSKTSEHYVKKLGIFPEKVQAAYFGTMDLGVSEQPNNSCFTIFSCSSAIPLKRLEKIAEVVCRLNFKVKWVHHGDGPTIGKVREIMQKAPDHVEFLNTAKIDDYKAVLEMERKLGPHCFINLSTTEGLPVTIMEALSFGIFVLVNDVGSCSEFIRPETGILFDKDAKPEEIAEKISALKENNLPLQNREGIRNFWKNNFSAAGNYSKFARDLKEIFRTAS